MNNIIQLRQEMAQERLIDLSKQYGMKSTRVNNYKNRMKDVLVSFNKFEVSTIDSNNKS